MFKIIHVTLTLLLILPLYSYAENYVVKENQRLEIDSVSTNNDTIQFFADDKKSYCCEIWSEKDDATGINFKTFTSAAPAEQVSVKSRGATSPFINPSTPDGIEFPARYCFIYNENSIIIGGLASFTGTLGPSATIVEDVKVHCRETSLYGGFNTVATDFNFIEITSNLNRNVAGEHTVAVRVRASGTISGTQVLDKTVNIEAGKRADIDVHSVAPSDFGPIVITHNGPPGSISARLVQYKITSPSPLEFQPVLVISFQEGKR